MSEDAKTECDGCDLVKLQFDYAWKWFSYHADQRTKMFNYMLIAMGIFASATVNALNSNQRPAVVILCAVSTIFALSFSRLDRRNEELVRLGEEVLAHLERTKVFATPPQIPDRKGDLVDFGILRRQAKLEGDGTWQSDARRGKHRFWLRALSYLIAAIFFAVGYWVLLLILSDR